MSLLDILFPKECFNCKKSGAYLCGNCVETLSSIKQKCIVCEKLAIDGFTHPRCKGKYTLDRVVSIWNYDGAIRRAIISLKYKFASEIVKELAEHVVHKLETDKIKFPTNAILIPIPMHWQRKNWRGFNQVEEIGKVIGQKLNLNFEPSLLIKTRKTKSQSELDMVNRNKNVQGVFSINPKNILDINENNSILFDDVYTTGATLKEAGKVLKKAGAKTVWALTITR